MPIPSIDLPGGHIVQLVRGVGWQERLAPAFMATPGTPAPNVAARPVGHRGRPSCRCAGGVYCPYPRPPLRPQLRC